MKLKSRQKSKTTSDLLPLMDCMFILLIYFIFSMMMMIINVNIPLLLPKLELEDNNSIVYAIEITEDSRIYWNKVNVPISIGFFLL